MTDKTQPPKSPTRREFFRKATAAAVGAAAGTAIAPKASEAKDAPAKGYRESEHVKRYYDLAKKF